MTMKKIAAILTSFVLLLAISGISRVNAVHADEDTDPPGKPVFLGFACMDGLTLHQSSETLEYTCRNNQTGEVFGVQGEMWGWPGVAWGYFVWY